MVWAPNSTVENMGKFKLCGPQIHCVADKNLGRFQLPSILLFWEYQLQLCGPQQKLGRFQLPKYFTKVGMQPTQKRRYQKSRSKQ